ncbi:MAG: hypothetical protein PHE55_16095 [Methylococcaceae bacterium]|nr:hypothetical protein [Methylococcaceae bacterium]
MLKITGTSKRHCIRLNNHDIQAYISTSISGSSYVYPATALYQGLALIFCVSLDNPGRTIQSVVITSGKQSRQAERDTLRTGEQIAE